MAGTLFVLFENASQTSTTDPDWANLATILVDDGVFTIADVTASPQSTETEIISLDGANLSSLVPIDAVIERLVLSYYAYYTEGISTGTSGVFVSINGGTAYGGSVAEGGPTLHTQDKTLAEWGLTQQQARDFIDGSLDAQCWGQKFNLDSETIDIDYVKVSAVYTTDFVNLPTLF